MADTEQTSGKEFGSWQWMILGILGRNNYYRVLALLCFGCVTVFFSPTGLFGVRDPNHIFSWCMIGLSTFSLCRGLYRDLAAASLFRQAPNAVELFSVSQKSSWPSRRGDLIAFPNRLSDRDEVNTIRGFSESLPDPLRAMIEINAIFEKMALRSLGADVRCFRVVRSYHNYANGDDLCPLPENSPKNDDRRRSYQTIGFGDKRMQYGIFPYYILCYMQIRIEGKMLHYREHIHGFSFSTWVKKEQEEFFHESSLPDAVMSLWQAAFAEYAGRASYGQHNSRGGSYSGQQTRTGRRER